MKCKIIFILLIGLQACSNNGFYKKIVSESSGSDFESIVHHEYCYFNNKKIGRCSFMDVSESKKFALIQDSLSGRLYVYDVMENKSIWLTDQFIGLVDKAVWSENESKVAVSGSDLNGVKWGPIGLDVKLK